MVGMFDFLPEFLSFWWFVLLIVFLGLIGFLIWNRKRQK